MARTLKSCLGVMSLVALLLFSGYGAAEAAIKAHTDTCNACHRMSGANPRAVNSLCLGCHVSGGPPDATTAGLFSQAAASNAFGHNAAAEGGGSQTSHFWGGSKSAMPEAGSQNPSTAFYTSRNAISTGLVTCSICHDPHGNKDTTIKELRTTTAATTDLDFAVCKQCHVAYYIENPSAQLTHPVGATAVPTVDPLKFNAPVVNIGFGTVQFVNGTVTCSSCHATHFADSNSTTVDGNEQTLDAGDGKLLRTDGALVNGVNAEDTANRRSAVCTACHPYKTHGNATEPMGCLTCHSAHIYGSTNVYVLRNSVTTTAFGAVSGLSYPSVPPVNLANNPAWADASGATTNGYCEKCHGDLLNMSLGGISYTRTHNVNENCRQCHWHNKAGALRSFEGSGCDGCHGAPPADATAGTSTGYAVDSGNGYNYFTSGVYKNETTTPHTSHSGTGSAYNFACAFCHNDYPNNHDNGSFQTVLVGTATFQPAVKPTGSTLNPAYNTTSPGTCNQVACHSNGGARTSDIARNYTAPRIAAVWDGGKGDIITAGVTNCAGCHGNTAATMGNNSARHTAHLNKGYTCNVCHKDTAANETTLAAGAKNTWHINGSQDVAFAAGGTYTKTAGTCAVTCHSTATPDWDDAATGACGSCHQYSVANVATGTGPALGDAHAKHLYAAAGGVQLACTVCHTNNGAVGSANADHVNGAASLVTNYQTTVCNPCHGAQDGITTVGHPDRQPVWTLSTSVTCEGCHTGTFTSSWNYGTPVSAPVKGTFATLGHGGVAAFNTAHPTDKCKACHAETTNHFTATADNMLTGGAAANSAFCQTCHAAASFKVHFATTGGSLTGDSCLICHESHGTGMGTNTGMMLVKGSGYTDGTTRASFANSFGTGICQTCHNSDVIHFNNVPTDESATHQGAAVCTQCHTHDKDPAFMYGSGTSCDGCHGFPPASNAHLLHAPNSHTADLAGTVPDTADMSACSYCHEGADLYTYNPTTDRLGGLNHGDDANRPSKMTTNIGYVQTDNNLNIGTCTKACHDGATGITASWVDNSLNCSACHYYEDTSSVANNTANANALGGSHNKHFASPYLCTSCHTTPVIAGDTAHITNRSGATELVLVQGMATAVAFEAAITNAARNTGVDPSASGSNATCNNLSCHNPSNGAYIATWSVANDVVCNFCHSGTNPATNKHTAHLTSGVTITCTKCHINNGVNTAHLNGTKEVTGTNVLSWVSPNCTNSCHNTAASSWTTGTLSCLDCHTIGKVGLYDSGTLDQAPSTGLHATTAAMAHDNQFKATAADPLPGSATCASCHQTTPTSQHLNGTGPTAFGSGEITYNFAASINSYTASGCASSCHKDGADWRRKWIGVVNATPAYTDLPTAAVCKNCHGSFAQGWNYVNELGATTSDHTDPDPDNVGDQMNAAQHQVCSLCHGWGNAAYQSGNMHNNNLIAMNAELNYDNGTGNCLNNCHGVNTLTTNTNSGFTNESGLFGAPGCGSCHDDGTIPPNSGAHAAHGANADTDYSECILCHGNNGDNYATTTGTHDDLSVTFAAGITYSNSGTVGTNALAADDTCSTTICHTASGTVTWGATSLGCSECHYYEATPLQANNTGINALSGSHNKHFGTGGITTCASCHPVLGAGDTTHINGATNLTDKANATIDEAEVTAEALGTGSNPVGNATCNNAACHNPSTGGTKTATWTVANAVGCEFCHVNASPGPNNGSHSKHMNAAGIFGKTIDCTNCHGTAPTSNAHRNGTVTFAAGMGYTAGAELVGTPYGNCTTSTCHNDGQGTFNVAVQTPDWGVVSADCTICHGNAPVTGAHAGHVNATFISGTCSECHTAANVSTHINSTRNMANKVTVYTGSPSFTCTNSCHIANTTNDWTPSGTLACTDCHGSLKVTTPALDRSWPPNTGAHQKHTGNLGGYVAANCVDCHNNNTSTHSTLNNVVTAAAYGKITVNPANGSCTNSCHLAGQAGDWTGGSAAVNCLDCHAGTYIGGNNATKGFNATPATGLHSGTLPISLNTHDDGFKVTRNEATPSGTCVSCHTSTPSTNHLNGTFTNSWNAAAPSINFATTVGFNDLVTPPTCGPNGALATCHDDDGIWKRRWSTSAQLSDGSSECANCHGDFTATFTTGVAVRHQTTTTGDDDGHIATGHTDDTGNLKCYLCHAYGDAAYLAGMHRDGNVQINSNVGFNSTTIGCSKCHADNDGTSDATNGHQFVATTTRWTRAMISGPPVTCASCHAYPPDPGDAKAAYSLEGEGAHLKHVVNIAAEKGVTLNATSDLFVDNPVCGACHNVSSAAFHTTGDSSAVNRNIAIPAGYQFGAAAPSYNGTPGQPSLNDPKTCSSVSCHFKSTPVWQ